MEGDSQGSWGRIYFEYYAGIPLILYFPISLLGGDGAQHTRHCSRGPLRRGTLQHARYLRHALPNQEKGFDGDRAASRIPLLGSNHV